MSIPEKVELKNKFLAVRDAQDVSTWLRGSSMIRQRIFQSAAWKEADQILCYVSFGTEVDTQAMLKEATRYKKRLVVPIFDPRRPRRVELSELKRFSDLVPGKNPDILEPRGQGQVKVDPATVDLALIPGIAFDRQGGRLGYGSGYFDTLLALMPNAQRWGLCFESQISETPLPHEAHDIRMNVLVTEKAIHEIA